MSRFDRIIIGNLLKKLFVGDFQNKVNNFKDSVHNCLKDIIKKNKVYCPDTEIIKRSQKIVKFGPFVKSLEKVIDVLSKEYIESNSFYTISFDNYNDDFYKLEICDNNGFRHPNYDNYILFNGIADEENLKELGEIKFISLFLITINWDIIVRNPKSLQSLAIKSFSKLVNTNTIPLDSVPEFIKSNDLFMLNLNNEIMPLIYGHTKSFNNQLLKYNDADEVIQKVIFEVYEGKIYEHFVYDFEESVLLKYKYGDDLSIVSIDKESLDIIYEKDKKINKEREDQISLVWLPISMIIMIVIAFIYCYIKTW